MRVLVLHNAVAADAPLIDSDVLDQAEAVGEALGQLGHGCETLAVTLDLEALRRQLLEIRPDVVFNLVESLGGSDRMQPFVPALLEAMGIPFTGNSAEAIFLSNQKVLVKRMLAAAGLPTPPWLTADRGLSPFPPDEPDRGLSPFPPDTAMNDPRGQRRKWGLSPSAPPLAFPATYFLKSITEHASVGLDDGALVEAAGPEELARQLAAHTARADRACFAEQYIEGREFHVSLLAGPEGPAALPPAEIDFSAFPPGKPRIVSYQAKWDEDSFEFHHTPRRFDFPPQDGPLLERLTADALACWGLLKLRGYARVDFRVDRGGAPWVLEVNANPCLTPCCIFPTSAAEARIGYAEVVKRLLADALQAVA